MRSRTSLFALLFLVAGIGLLAVPAAGTVDGGLASVTPADTTSPTVQQPAAEIAGSQTADSVVEPCADEPPDDYADPAGDTEDVIGWVDGYWYDEPLDIDTDEELTEEELLKLANRTAARFEAMRCLPAKEGVPPVEIITRDEFRASSVGGEGTDGTPTDQELFDNTKLQTLLMVEEGEDSSTVRDEQRGELVAGFYDFIRNEIVIVSEDPDSLLIDEPILAHEIGHAIQDQHFDLSQYDRPTVDIDNGKLGLIEGDVHLIEHRYLDACESDQWAEPCVTLDEPEDPTSDPDADTEDGEDSGVPNWGLYFKQFQPYSDGPSFVEYVYEERGGWEAVDELYENPPRSAIEVAHPEKYGVFEPADVDVPDRSSDDWDRIVSGATAEDEAYDTLGIGGITALFAQLTLEGVPEHDQVFRFEEVVNLDAMNEIDVLNPHNYDHPETEGWRDDKLFAYRNGENETAAVWRLAWESEADAQPFVDSYGQLLEARGGERVDGFAYTYEFDDVTYDMAVTVVPDGDEVTVVVAPGIEELTAVHGNIELVGAGDENETGENGERESSGTTDDTSDDTADDDDRQSDTEDDATDADDDGAGFGIAAIAAGLAVLGLLGIRRQ